MPKSVSKAGMADRVVQIEEIVKKRLCPHVSLLPAGSSPPDEPAPP